MIDENGQPFPSYAAFCNAKLLEDNPSLKPYLEEALRKAYLKGVELAVGETDLPKRTFPVECPYS
ncbi:DUF29 family protein [Nostoc sp. NMS7]|uniref:DUF29 family protein n=1 Tax=Nostoc sp. NMS7 TaxID=2815391 RepID=UPI0025DD1214|nr:DUF29 family protein [Nostoc sp. NMS7]